MAIRWTLERGEPFMDGHSRYLLRRVGKPGVRGMLTLMPDEAEEISRLLDVRAEPPPTSGDHLTGYSRNGGDMDAWRAESAEAAAHPRVGDRFQDHYSWWVYPVRVTETTVTWLSGLSFPNGATVHEGTREEYAEWIVRKGLLLEDRDNDYVAAGKWYERSREPKESSR